MSVFDEKIKQTEREIGKLLSDIEKKKARIAELRIFKKDCEAKRQRDNTYSDSLLQGIFKMPMILYLPDRQIQNRTKLQKPKK